MGAVMVALLPGTLLMVHWFGPGVLMNLLVVVLTALVSEAACLRLRRRALQPVIADGSMVLAAWLLALCLPPSVPFGQLIVGAVAMSVLGKHLYGGLGQNPFNPAMVGYAVLLVSFPTSMTTWMDPGQFTALTHASNWADWWALKWQYESSLPHWDAITQATPLDRLRSLERQALTPNINELHSPPWRAISLAWLVGGGFYCLKASSAGTFQLPCWLAQR